MTTALFAGSRCAVYDAAQRGGVNVARVLAPKNSPLYRQLEGKHPHLEVLSSKEQLEHAIRTTGFDVMISNGCPYILPVSQLKNANQHFVNVHPSLLPAFKGKHPINGAMLFGQPAGASCHEMVDEVDTGPVIARVPVDVDTGVDVRLLYRLAFFAEGEAFGIALARQFRPAEDLPGFNPSPSRFDRTEKVLTVDFRDPLELTIRRVNAFSVPGQFARFRYGGELIQVRRATRVVSTYLDRAFAASAPGTILFQYDDTVVIKLGDGVLQLDGLPECSRSLQAGENVLTGRKDDASYAISSH
jgi:methionyl-tRNA formyltransferase